MSSKSATTDPRAFSLSFALAACSRSFFCNFSSYVSGASPVGSGLGARVKVTSTCIVKRAESAAWRRADSAQCPGLSGADSAQCPTGWVPSGLASPPGGARPATRAAGRALRRRSGRARRPHKAALWPRAMAPRPLRSHMAPRTLRPCSTHLYGALGRERDRQRRGDSRRAIPQQGLAWLA